MVLDIEKEQGFSLPYLTHYLFNLFNNSKIHKHKLLMLDKSKPVTKHISDTSVDCLEVYCYVCKLSYTFFIQISAAKSCGNNPTHIFICQNHSINQYETNVEIRCVNCDLSIIYLQPQLLFPQDELEKFSSNYKNLDANITALKTFSTYLSNLFDGQSRLINSQNQNLANKIGWNESTQNMFKLLGFQISDQMIHPPPPEELSRSKRYYLAFILEIYRIALLHGKDEVLKDSYFTSANQRIFSLLGDYPPRNPKSMGNSELTLNLDALEPPYSHFNCTPDLSDQVLLYFYRHLSAMNPLRQPVLVDSLVDIAQLRSSEILSEEAMLIQSQGIIGQRERLRAYNDLGITDFEIADHEVLTEYINKVNNDPLNESEYRQSLKTIASIRGSSILYRYIDSGVLPDTNLPVGLNNIGNTCYLNSLLQYYYSLYPLYNRVMGFSPDHVSTPKTPLVIDERPVNEEEIQQANLFATHLKALFIILSEEKEHASVSPSQQLALMALGHMDIQPTHQDISAVVESMRQATKADNAPQSVQPFSTPKEPVDISPSPINSPLINHPIDTIDMAKELIEIPDDNDDNDDNDDKTDALVLPSTEQIPSMPSPMDVGGKSPLEENMIVEETLALGSQQDVSECMDHMMRQIERAFLSQPDQPDSNLIKQLFYGKTRQVISYINPKTGELVKSTKLEDFSNLILNIQNRSCSLYDCLDEYFQTSKVEMGEVEADRELSIENSPPFLQIQLQRVQFDPVLLQAYKSQAFIELIDTLHLDWYTTKYVDEVNSNSESNHFRQKASKIRDDIRENKDRVKYLTRSRNNFTFKDSIQKMIGHYENQKDLNSNGANTALNCYLGSSLETPKIDRILNVLKNDLNHLENDIEEKFEQVEKDENRLQSILGQTQDLSFHLHAVFIHSGLASFGHYWVYIKDWKKNRWLKYNDEFVSEVSNDEIFKDTTGLTANPYYVVYIREDFKNQLINDEN